MSDALLRPALEAAWLLARAAETTAPGSAPRSLRPLLGHARLTTAALRTIRRALDEDDDFRSVVAASTTEQAVGRGAWLFLDRPDGWEDELAGLAAEAAESSDAANAAREERSAVRRLRGAEEALRRAEDALGDARAEAGRAAADLADERRTRRAAEAEARAVGERMAALERERDEARSRLEELTPLTERVEDLERALDEARRAQPPTGLSDEARAVLADAAAASRALADMLDAALASLTDEAVSEVATASVEPVPPATTAVDAPRTRRRRPVSLPPAIRDDSPEAAEHLVRRRGALLLVDGYNASLRYRPDLPIAVLRQRFADALDELSARTGVDVHVVFDGATVSEGVVAASSRRGRARVTFSPPDTEADDVILHLIEKVPVDRPVLVASDDRRVRDGAEQRGANVLSTRQLLAVLRREPEG